MKYVLGVDGGNTKTHYLLYTSDAKFVAARAAGSCSHETAGGFEGAAREMGANIAALLSQCGGCAEDIEYAAFGLAGADFEWQKQKLREIVAAIGIKNFSLDNDGFLALKAGTANGVGVCSINGTGTVTVGVNDRGERLQIGGMGDVCGDYAGAGILARSALTAVYRQLYKNGRKTAIKGAFYKKYAIERDEDFLPAALGALASKEGVYEVNLMMEKAEREGDEAVADILRSAGEDLGSAAAACIERLGFSGEVDVVLAGSVWVKGKFQAMRRAFDSVLESRHLPVNVGVLCRPPAIGAVIWALEEANKHKGGLTAAQKSALLIDNPIE